MTTDTPTRESQTLSIGIDVPLDAAYAFLSDPQNFSRWAAGLGEDFHQVSSGWVALTPIGRSTIRFADLNDYGVLDHVVELPDGTLVDVPMRVVPNARGSEVMLTLFRQQGMSDEQFDSDVAAVRRDLDALKQVLEAGG